MKTLIRTTYDGRVCAGGCFYNDTKDDLLKASAEWLECAKAVVVSAQQDTDWALRRMGAQAALYRRAISRALKHRAKK